MSKTPDFVLATVGAVYTDGVSLIFDGQSTASAKHYKCNNNVGFKAGDRVKVYKDSGTYIVEYIVGKPGSGSNVGPQGPPGPQGGPGPAGQDGNITCPTFSISDSGDLIMDYTGDTSRLNFRLNGDNLEVIVNGNN